jgi:hypothetical protein
MGLDGRERGLIPEECTRAGQDFLSAGNGIKAYDSVNLL